MNFRRRTNIQNFLLRHNWNSFSNRIFSSWPSYCFIFIMLLFYLGLPILLSQLYLIFLLLFCLEIASNCWRFLCYRADQGISIFSWSIYLSTNILVKVIVAKNVLITHFTTYTLLLFSPYWNTLVNNTYSSV